MPAESNCLSYTDPYNGTPMSFAQCSGVVNIPFSDYTILSSCTTYFAGEDLEPHPNVDYISGSINGSKSAVDTDCALDAAESRVYCSSDVNDSGFFYTDGYQLWVDTSVLTDYSLDVPYVFTY